MWTIFVSEIASCIGYNPYETPSKAATKIWKRKYPSSYNDAIEKYEIVPDEVVVAKFVEKYTDVLQTAIQEDNAQKRDALVKTIIQETKDTKGPDGPDLDSLKKGLLSHVHTNRGIRDEAQSIQRYQQQHDKQVRENNAKFYRRFYQYQSIAGEKKSFMVGGRVDGITQDGVLIEVKNRQRRLFHSVPLYEKVQVHAYMLLTGLDKCEIIECLGLENEKHSLEFDADFWQNVVIRLEEFILCMDHLLESEEAQKQLVVDKQLYIPPYILRDLSGDESEDEDGHKLN